MMRWLLMVCLVVLISAGVHGDVFPRHQETNLEAHNLSPEEIDAIAAEALEAFHVPGASISLILNDQTLLSRGYGFRDLERKLPVTEHTLFPIASCTKAFTTTVLSQLVEEGKIAFDDPVQKYIPEFFLADAQRSAETTIRDLLAHRTGMARHDALWLFSDMSRDSIVELIGKLEPASGLREEFQYNNLMYSVAGMVAERVEGQSWEDIVAARLFAPLGMQHSATSLAALHATSDFSLPYADIRGTVQEIPFCNTLAVNPGGGIISSAAEMAAWLKLHLGQDETLIHPQTLEEMHAVHMPFAGKPDPDAKVYNQGYGLGWHVGEYRGCRFVNHGGDIDGFSSEVSLLPELGIGIVILTNSSTDGRAAITAMRNQIFDKVLGADDVDWMGKYLKERAKGKKLLKGILDAFDTARRLPSTLPLEDYVGRYVHPVYGAVEITIDGGRLLASYGKATIPLYAKSEGAFAGKFDALLTYGINPIADLTFFKNASGQVYRLDIPFEGFRSARPIPFTRED